VLCISTSHGPQTDNFPLLLLAAPSPLPAAHNCLSLSLSTAASFCIYRFLSFLLQLLGALRSRQGSVLGHERSKRSSQPGSRVEGLGFRDMNDPNHPRNQLFPSFSAIFCLSLSLLYRPAPALLPLSPFPPSLQKKIAVSALCQCCWRSLTLALAPAAQEEEKKPKAKTNASAKPAAGADSKDEPKSKPDSPTKSEDK